MPVVVVGTDLEAARLGSNVVDASAKPPMRVTTALDATSTPSWKILSGTCPSKPVP